MSLEKKLLLSLAAVILNLSLAISGTRMLLSVSVETVNVITFGNLTVRLDEIVGQNGEVQPSPVHGDGYAWQGLLPSDEVTKKPYVTHTGGTDAYLRVGVELRMPEWDTLTELQRVSILRIINDGMAATIGETWVCAPVALTTGNTPVYFYYTDPATKSLAVFQSGDVTEPIFTTFVIPPEFGSEEIGGAVINLVITAQAIQLGHNEYEAPSGNDIESYYAALAAPFRVFDR